jgi:branched-chain amino acid transport system permease protein
LTFDMDYLLHIAVLFCIYGALAVSLNLAAGCAGMVSVSHAAVFGIGAYAAALVAGHHGWAFVPSAVFAACAGAVSSVVVSVAAARVKNDYFTLVTFAFQMIIVGLMNNLSNLTGGPIGMAGVPAPQVFGWACDRPADCAALGLIWLSIVALICGQFTRGSFGRALRAIREDDDLLRSYGKNPFAFKTIVLAVSSALAAVCGAFYASYSSYIDPTSFSVMESLFVLSIIVVGGADSVCGSIVASALLIAVPEALRFSGLPSGIAANLRQMIYAVVLVGIVMLRPRGILGAYEFGRIRRDSCV